MYGWTDPNHPDDAPRRPEQPFDEQPPAWLTDRPEPRSAYLFGDDPDRPEDEWHRDRPTARWQPEPAPPPPARRAAPAEPATGWRPGPAEPSAGWQPGPAADRRTEPGDGRSAEPAPVIAEGRHRSRRRLSRPALIGGAAMAATLVVSLGVGAVALIGDGPETDPSAAVDTAAAPVPPAAEQTPGDPAPTTPSAAPTTAKPTPSATRTARPTPSRSTAPSRRHTERSTPPAGGGTKAPVGSAGVSGPAREVVNLVNAERAKAGCGALSVDDKLTTAAQRHSQDQADHRKMSHTGSDGSDVGDRLDRVGYSWRTYGENVAWNQQTPAAVMDAWMNSSGHRANILNCAFTEIGVGVASSNGPYWTQVFAAPR
ncbi:CAP domain-containing protein [Micromonospora sp. CPCC 205561]|uniref:CAP domain-containing protein n=1 Tax=Micromonospora sp. CPCC 205561 TaxID=3122407 RepID=UPI002FEF9561